MKTLVSILIPIYGVEKYIEKCCRSLFEQTYSEIEYIFVDDCSPDNSVNILLRILKEYPGRVSHTKVIRHNVNKGLSSARNTAVANAEGEYILHVDSDDYLDKDAVTQLLGVAFKEGADVVVFDAIHVYPNKKIEEHQKIATDKNDYIKQLITYKVSVCVWGKFYKSTLFKNCGVDFVENLNFGEDYVVTPRIVYYANKIVYYEKCLYNYTHINTSSYTISYKPKNIEDLKKAICILADFFSKNGVDGEYEYAIQEAKLRSKINILIAICLSKKTMWTYITEVNKLYLDVGLNLVAYPYKCILWLSKKKWNALLYLFVIIGFKIKQILK